MLHMNLQDQQKKGREEFEKNFEEAQLMTNLRTVTGTIEVEDSTKDFKKWLKEHTADTWKAAALAVLEDVRREGVYEVDVGKKPSIQDEAWGNQFDNKCEAFWHGESEGLKGITDYITKREEEIKKLNN